MHWLRERIHPTWHLTAVLLGFVGGIIVSLWISVPVVYSIIGAVVLIIIAFWKQRRVLVVAACVAGLLLGNARGAVDMSARDAYQSIVGRHVTIRAVVADDVDQAKRERLHVKLRDVQYNDTRLPGRMFATVEALDTVHRSDIVTIDAHVDSGFGNFTASLTGKVTSVERPMSGDVALDIRDGFARHVASAIHEPAASLGTGYLLGKKSALSDDLVAALQITGLTHIVVASGYNLTILVRACRRMFARVSKYLAAVSGLGLVVGFIAMTGASATMTRAGIVAALGLWAWYYGRAFHPVTLLSSAAVLTLVIDPSYAWGDLGWALSFAAFAGVMIIAPIVTNYFFSAEKVPFIAQVLVETVCAQIATLPIMVVAFHQLSVIAPFANLLILPLIPLAMILIAFAGIGAWLLPGAASVFGWPAQTLLDIQLRVIGWCADVPGALMKPDWSPLIVVLYVSALIGAIWYMKWRTRFPLRAASLIE